MSKGLKTNKWYPITVTPKKKGTDGIVGITDMGWLFELYYDENGIWKKSVIRNHKVYFEPIVEPNTNYNPFTHWKKVR